MRATRLRAAGFTLIEIMIVVVIIGIVAVIAFDKNGSPAAYTVQSQAELFAANLRHTQSLATTWSRSLSVGLTGGTNGSNYTGYTVNCVNPSTSPPCNSTPVVDPATGSSFNVGPLQNTVTISGPASLNIDSFGNPSAAATYTFTGSTVTVKVTVAATTGFVTVAMQ